MAVNIPFSDEKYMQLIAQGFSDKECAMKLHVKQSILVNEYLPAILQKAGLATREEAVIYAQQKVEEEERGIPSEDLVRILRGTGAAQARAFYRALERHFFQDDCAGCKSYDQYGVLLVKGQFYKHMDLFVPSGEQNVFELIDALERTGMIHVQKNDELYRVTFMHLQPKEEGHGDQTI